MPPESVRLLFDGYADRFDGDLVATLRYRTPEMLQQMFARWVGQRSAVSPGFLTMIDAGCGTGLCGAWMAPYRGRLIGIDLSRRMIAKAHERAVYDELVAGDVVEQLLPHPASIDLIVAADVLVYLGDLAPFFAAAASALRPGGVLLFSVEATQSADFTLLPTQRFAHSMPYLLRLTAAHGLSVRDTDRAVIRLEKGKDVQGYLLLAEKAAG